MRDTSYLVCVRVVSVRLCQHGRNGKAGVPTVPRVYSGISATSVRPKKVTGNSKTPPASQTKSSIVVCSYLLFVTLERAEGMSCPVISCYRYVTCTPEYSSSTKLTEPQRMHKTSAWDPVMAALSLMMSAIC